MSYASFTRKLDTGDVVADNALIRGALYNLIWAHGQDGEELVDTNAILSLCLFVFSCNVKPSLKDLFNLAVSQFLLLLLMIPAPVGQNTLAPHGPGNAGNVIGVNFFEESNPSVRTHSLDGLRWSFSLFCTHDVLSSTPSNFYISYAYALQVTDNSTLRRWHASLMFLAYGICMSGEYIMRVASAYNMHP